MADLNAPLTHGRVCDPGVRHRTGRIARFVARTGNAATISEWPSLVEAVWKHGLAGRGDGVEGLMSVWFTRLPRRQAWIASLSGLTPRIAITRFML
jgi:hypothetical protein